MPASIKMKLTKRAVDALIPPAGGETIVWDADVTGFGLRLSSRGRRTYFLHTRTKGGRQVKAKLGAHGAITVDQARDLAKRELGRIAAGADPIAGRAAARKQGQQPTVAVYLAQWQAEKEQDWSLRYAGEVKRIAEVEIIPTLGARPLVETRRVDWTDLVAQKRKTAPAMASLLYRVVNSFLGFGEAKGWIPATILPRKGQAILAPPPTRRRRILTDDELCAVWRGSTSLFPKARVFVRLLILTAAREMQVDDIMVGEVDRDAARWTIPSRPGSKKAPPITLPLGPLALAELAAIWPNNWVPPEWKLLRVRNYGRLKRQLDALSGIADWRWHDLRRTARTNMTKRLGVLPVHAEMVLGHVSARTPLERTYDQHDYGPEIIAVSLRWQAYVEQLVGAAVEPSSFVTETEVDWAAQ